MAQALIPSPVGFGVSVIRCYVNTYLIALTLLLSAQAATAQAWAECNVKHDALINWIVADGGE